jgi:electron transfer flavoprotein beta subunit
MKFAVCVKQAIDEAELKIDQGGKPLLEGAATKMSTFDKNSTEEALRLKSTQGGEVVVFTVGRADARKTLKEALAMGADRGVLVIADPLKTDALRTAELLASCISKAGPFDLVLCSEGSSDVYTGAVPAMVAELMGVPFVGFARKVEIATNVLKAERSLEDSVEIVETGLPAVVSVVSEINEPRYPTLIQIMQASKKPVEEIGESTVPASSRTRASLVSMSAQATNRRHLTIEGSPEEAAAKLLGELQKEGLVS